MIESQYIDIFTKYNTQLCSQSSEGLNAYRQKAFEAFEKNGFPTTKNEDYKYVNIAALFEPDFGLNINRVPVLGDPFKAFNCAVAVAESDIYYVLNDLFYSGSQVADTLPKGVFVGSLLEFSNLHRDLFDTYYAKLANVEDNGITAFNTMFAQDGFVVYVPDNVVIEKPIQLVNMLKSKFDYLVNRRILVIMGKNAHAKFLMCDHTADNRNFLSTQVVEIFLDQYAQLEVCDMVENSDKVSRLSSVYVRQDESSVFRCTSVGFYGGITRNDFYVSLEGSHAELDLSGFVIADKKQYFDNFVFVDHKVPDCLSNQLFKYVVQDHSVGSFCGRILVDKDAQKTQAFQVNKNLCTDDARMYSKPQLEIYADDVKCSHGLTTGQLDEEALFYMRARGIDKEQATFMLKQAFASDVIEKVKVDTLKSRLYDLLERRFKGEEAHCGNCAGCAK